ncbi:hypothetical protein CLG96_09190 [Sphingomonas oleivorans]|uniref:histidine kinase n=1 Tax=Sphingomonas oleivorans TaxID=1735121 RepID=A0A2T5FYJ7_9SPHN|nr:HAMP domain-containing sensor histidine kinase [Sphingomonas oleivorans]PTQ11592.1 hypothetical protein CLG96_09190 [Sphingomonas oleivorans]
MQREARQADQLRRYGREFIHDLRNLFGVIASARHMLEDDPTTERRMLLLEAIEDAAMRGGRLTTDLLALSDPGDPIETLDLNGRLRQLEPLLCALGGPTAAVRIDLCREPLPVRTNAAGFEAVMLELVANARAALTTPGRILIRTRRRNGNAAIIVADTGCGMPPQILERALSQITIASAAGNGTGLGRVRHYVHTTGGLLRIRSRTGRGTVVSIRLPAQEGTASKPTAEATHRGASSPKEKEHEKRRSITV